jgi:uncharacterized repeat protein (TIGR01451 family)
MTCALRLRRGLRVVPLFVGVILALWQISVALAQAPQPNPLAVTPPRFPFFASQVVPLPGVDLQANGTAATLHGDPLRGRTLFQERCALCHGPRGTGQIPNQGSDDGTVPPLNPIDPGFLEQARGDPASLVRAIDRFIQHGSRPAGDNPERSMIPWGDRGLLSQDQIADAEAYVMQLNGLYWPDRWTPPAEVQMDAKRDGDTFTYSITVLNHSDAALESLNLRDTLPTGVTYLTSYVPDPGQNPGKWSGSVVEWTNQDGVSAGGVMGPFVIVARATGPESPPNVAELFFTWSSWDGTRYRSSAISDAVVPGP